VTWTTRRAFLGAGLRTAGLVVAASALACDSARPRRGFLGLMEGVMRAYRAAAGRVKAPA
jgi:hypothetical protein